MLIEWVASTWHRAGPVLSKIMGVCWPLVLRYRSRFASLAEDGPGTQSFHRSPAEPLVRRGGCRLKATWVYPAATW